MTDYFAPVYMNHYVSSTLMNYAETPDHNSETILNHCFQALQTMIYEYYTRNHHKQLTCQ